MESSCYFRQSGPLGREDGAVWISGRRVAQAEERARL